MIDTAEYKGFVFAIVFIIVFAGLVSSIPAGFLGPGETVNALVPVNPSLLNDFTSYKNYTKSAFAPLTMIYEYDLDSRTWQCAYSGSTFYLAAKVYWFFLWLGAMDSVKFVSDGGVDRGQGLSLSEIAEDATDGSVTYTLTYVTTGTSAGGFVVFWNSTLYSDPADAWTNNVLYLVHGVGITTTANTNIISLLLQLLLLQLPDCPTLVNLILAAPVWAAIVYLIWFIIKESLPFV